MAIPQLPKSTIEYRLSIIPSYSEQKKKRYLLFVLETVREFSSFQYDLVVDEKMNSNTITLKIQGLKPHPLTMPGFGSAQFRKEYYGLRGTYTLNIIRQDRAKNQFRIHVSGKKVEIVKGVLKRKFVEVGVTESQSVP